MSDVEKAIEILQKQQACAKCQRELFSCEGCPNDYSNDDVEAARVLAIGALQSELEGRR